MILLISNLLHIYVFLKSFPQDCKEEMTKKFECRGDFSSLQPKNSAAIHIILDLFQKLGDRKEIIPFQNRVSYLIYFNMHTQAFSGFTYIVLT